MSGEILVNNTSDHFEWKGKIKTPVGEYTYVGQNIHEIPAGRLKGRITVLP